MSIIADLCAECGCKCLKNRHVEPTALWATTEEKMYCDTCADISVPPIPPVELGVKLLEELGVKLLEELGVKLLEDID